MYKEKSRVRKSEQKRYGKENRLLLKNSKRILTKRAPKLNDEQKQRVNAILYISDALGQQDSNPCCLNELFLKPFNLSVLKGDSPSATFALKFS